MSVITRGTFENVEPERAFTILIHELKKRKKKLYFRAGYPRQLSRDALPLYLFAE